MDALHFDRLTRTLIASTFRRRALGAVLLGALHLPSLGDEATAGPGCRNVGRECRRSNQCCSGICKGKKKKRKCRAHDTGGCKANQDVCLDADNATCTTSTGLDGECFRTTGNSRYCAAAGEGECFECRRDSDCEPFCGAGAACIVCSGDCEETGGTGCVGLGECEFPED